jgi:hypothetical protein
MEAEKRQVRSGDQYDALFPRADLMDSTIKRGATVSDTVKFIPKVVEESKWQTEKLARLLKDDSVYDTCKNIWDFVYRHIAYHKDKEGYEQIRSPARAWHDRKQGVDCDCYTVFISTILSNLKIPHRLRITKYKEDRFQHIYPVAEDEEGKQIVIDCVVNTFNYEEPYSEKQDTKMDLQYLSGLESTPATVDQQDLFGDDELGFKFNLPKLDLKHMTAKDAFKKFAFVTNRANPATVTLRNGLLAALKINMFKLGSMLRWAYTTEADAQKRGINMNNWHKLVKVKDKIENIFYTAGGKPENLKKAILHGRGNRDHQVNGFGDISESELNSIHADMPLSKILGEEIYHSENVEGMEDMEGIGELGEPYTAASIAAATGVLGAIAALIKNIGGILPKKDKAAKDFDPKDKTGTPESDPTSPDTGDKTQIEDHVAPPDSSGGNHKTKSLMKKTAGGSPSTGDQSTENGSGGADEKPPGFWEKNKKWLKPTLFGAGGLSLIFGGYKAFEAHKKKEGGKKPLEGVKTKPKRKGGKKPVNLM